MGIIRAVPAGGGQQQLLAHSFDHVQLLTALILMILMGAGFLTRESSAFPYNQAFIARITSSGRGYTEPMYTVSSLGMGTPNPQPLKLLLSTEATSYPWLQCGYINSTSTGANNNIMYDWSQSTSMRIDHSCYKGSPCSSPLSPFDNYSAYIAYDKLSLHTTNGRFEDSMAIIPEIAFACADAQAIADLNIIVTGVAPLSAAKHALPAQLHAKSGMARKFAYCLPRYDDRSPAPLFLGDGISYLFGFEPQKINVSALLQRAGDPVPLKFDSEGRLYMGVTDIRINKEKVKRGSGKLLKLRVSTTEAFTKLSRQVYVVVRDKFRTKAQQMGLQQVATPISGLPFDTCYNESNIGWVSTGYNVPIIQLGLLASPRIWRVRGQHSMVWVSPGVLCWAFLDAGSNNTSVLGTFQQQDHLLEFDLPRKTFNFIDFYHASDTSCTNFYF